MAALDSVKVPAEPTDLLSSDGEDEQSGDLDLGRAMTRLRVSVGEPADGDDDDDDDGAGPSRVASIAAPSISTKVREVGLYKRTAQDAAAVQRLGGGAGEADDAAATMLAMGLSLNHRGWVLKMGGTRLGALQTGAVWHKRWVVIENGTLEYFTEEVKEGRKGIAKSKEPLPLAGLEIHSPARTSKMILGKHAPLSFELVDGRTSKSFVFCTASRRELSLWMSALRAGGAGGADGMIVGAPPGASPVKPRASLGEAPLGAALTSRQPRTTREEMEESALHEFALLSEISEELRGGAEAAAAGGVQPEAVQRLLDGLRATLGAHQLIES